MGQPVMGRAWSRATSRFGWSDESMEHVREHEVRPWRGLATAPELGCADPMLRMWLSGGGRDGGGPGDLMSSQVLGRGCGGQMGGWSLHGWLEPERALRSVDTSRRGKKPSLPGSHPGHTWMEP